MTGKLFFRAAAALFVGFAVVAALLFLPAGTWNWAGGWRLLGLLFVPMGLLGIVLMVRDPALLSRRLQNKESEPEQRSVIGGSALMFLAGFVTAGLDYRFGWSHVPGWVVAAASVVLLVSYGLYAEVMRENTWLSRTVEVQENQTVVDTGLYGIVRHPMYAVTVALLCSMPLVLGSWYGFAIFCVYPLLLVRRIQNEEQVLNEGLPGYREYCRKVRWRMFPYLW